MLEKFFKNVESVETAFCCYISVVYKFSIFHVFHTFEKKIRFMGVFDTRFHTFAPKFRKIDTKKFANVILCGFLIPSSTLLICKKCGYFMISPHSCHNMCQYVSTTPISTFETRCHSLEIFDKNYLVYTLK